MVLDSTEGPSLRDLSCMRAHVQQKVKPKYYYQGELKERRRVTWKQSREERTIERGSELEIKDEGAISGLEKASLHSFVWPFLASETIGWHSRQVYFKLYPLCCTELLASLSGQRDATKASICYLLLFLFGYISWYCVVFFLLCDGRVLMTFMKLLEWLKKYVKKVL